MVLQSKDAVATLQQVIILSKYHHPYHAVPLLLCALSTRLLRRIIT